MNVFLNVHAEPRSFNGALFRTAQDTLRAAIMDCRWAKAETLK
jgi:hypothetical protein